MTNTSALPASSSQCLYRSPSGRHCRQLAENAGVGLCSKHAAPHFSFRPNANFLRRLTVDSDDFTTALGIHNSVSELYKLLAADVISSRRAAVLAYIANLLLRTIPIVHSEIDANAENQPVRIDFGDLPRPDRSGSTLVPKDGLKELSTSAASNGQDLNE